MWVFFTSGVLLKRSLDEKALVLFKTDMKEKQDAVVHVSLFQRDQQPVHLQ